jgi:glycosyltransferase involved in cell wall biosynthesis
MTSGISKCKGDWILLLDADERPSPMLAWYLSDLCQSGVSGYTIQMRCYYDERYSKYTQHLEHGAKPGRLFKRSALTHPGGVHRDLRIRGPTATLYPPYYLAHLKPGKWSLTVGHNAWIREEIETTPGRGFLVHAALAALDPARWFFGVYLVQRAWADGWVGLAGATIIARWRFLIHAGLAGKSLREGKWFR